MKKIAAFMFTVFVLIHPLRAATYQTPDDFLKETFADGTPPPEVVWLTDKLSSDATAILGHKPAELRVRYWRNGERTAWILDEIGKEKPITTGIAIYEGKIERIRVLVFRERRGWEVRHEFFTDQFKQLGLTADMKLDGPVDGVSGATLSVRALTNLARLALYLHKHVTATSHAAP